LRGPRGGGDDILLEVRYQFAAAEIQSGGDKEHYFAEQEAEYKQPISVYLASE
jgi:hypothetical protein